MAGKALNWKRPSRVATKDPCKHNIADQLSRLAPPVPELRRRFGRLLTGGAHFAQFDVLFKKALVYARCRESFSGTQKSAQSAQDLQARQAGDPMSRGDVTSRSAGQVRIEHPHHQGRQWTDWHHDARVTHQ